MAAIPPPPAILDQNPIRGFRGVLADRVFTAITADCKAADPRFDYLGLTFQWEGPLWRLVSDRPAHLLPPEHETWDEALLAAVDRLAELTLALPISETLRARLIGLIDREGGDRDERIADAIHALGTLPEFQLS